MPASGSFGSAVGLYFTPQVVGWVAGLWWAVALKNVWAFALGLAFGAWLHRMHHVPACFTSRTFALYHLFFGADLAEGKNSGSTVVITKCYFVAAIKNRVNAVPKRKT